MSITNPRPVLSLCALPFLMLSCQELNPEFCTEHPADVVCFDAGGGGGSGIANVSCASDSECASPAPVCEKTRSMCVQCTADEPGACGGATPICGDDDVCRSCAIDTECESMTCLPDGSCAAALNVLYVAIDGSDTSSCIPTEKCSLLRAIALIDGTRSTIRLDPGWYTFASRELILTTTMRLVGRGAVLDHGPESGVEIGNGNTVIIRRGTASPPPHVELDYVEVVGGSRHAATSGVGIACENSILILHEGNVNTNNFAGITSFNCVLTITHSRIAQNYGYGLSLLNGNMVMSRSVISENPAGGIIVSGMTGGELTFDLQNNFIVRNGLLSSDTGGVSFEQLSPPGPYVFDFNTVAFNAANGTVPGPGVTCQTVQDAAPVFANNIVFNNATPLSFTQVSGDRCSWVFSDIAPLPPIPIVGGNIVVDPQFVDVAQGDFHLGSDSPLRDAADPAATLGVDIDGQARPQGTGREMGADEIK